ncbi:glycosyltransferase family 9 protein [Ramlibacter ginsenosidimutans]|uniref:Glycosyltransferase family 9 protein n=1 Tax=Ramlibacter ginsenosidimutans TaxID=502333 RepID=A0A934TRP0_9BURK|nr:glycosyltransferase family 9 protein [Ramlibacter ginsenosidimutans]MBK6005770.1 glycosyltransferase family 9 protein [Ramlibacter ginsenosidimutans]
MMSSLPRVRESALARLIDQAAGTAVLALWGTFRRRRSLPHAPRRFGVMMFETIGDSLLAGSLVASLRESMPNAEIVIFASRGNRGILQLFEGISSVVEVPLTRPTKAVAAIRSVPVDVMIDIGQWPRWYAFLCAIARARYTIGFATPGQTRHYAYDRAIPHDPAAHEVENFQRLLSPLPGVAALPPERALRPVGPPPAYFAMSAPYVIVHPWASGFRHASREWPLPLWADLISRLCNLGLSVYVTGSPADQPKAEALASSCAVGLPVRSAAGRLSLAELAAVLRGAAAVVAVNTGVMHLAALLDTPLVALHGPTSRRRWGPTGRRSIAMAPSTGAEFLSLGFEYPAGVVDCMASISVDEVFAAVLQQLQLQQEPSPA